MNPKRIAGLGLLGGLAGTALAGGAVAAAWHRMARRPLPKQSGTIELEGLAAPVRVRRDRWGVPHVEAAGHDDLFFAQGFCHGQDRLWQMDFYRRVVRGRLSEFAGDDTLPVDRLMRTLGMRRAAEREEEARRALGRAREVGEEYEDVGVSTEVIRARKVGAGILEAARRSGAEAIVIGGEPPSKIRGGAKIGGIGAAKPAEIGAATEYVLKKAPCRVLLTAPPEAAPEPAPGPAVAD